MAQEGKRHRFQLYLETCFLKNSSINQQNKPRCRKTFHIHQLANSNHHSAFQRSVICHVDSRVTLHDIEYLSKRFNSLGCNTVLLGELSASTSRVKAP